MKVSRSFVLCLILAACPGLLQAGEVAEKETSLTTLFRKSRRGLYFLRIADSQRTHRRGRSGGVPDGGMSLNVRKNLRAPEDTPAAIEADKSNGRKRCSPTKTPPGARAFSLRPY